MKVEWIKPFGCQPTQDERVFFSGWIVPTNKASIMGWLYAVDGGEIRKQQKKKNKTGYGKFVFRHNMEIEAVLTEFEVEELKNAEFKRGMVIVSEAADYYEKHGKFPKK